MFFRQLYSVKSIRYFNAGSSILCCAKGSVLSMVLFVFFLVCCFQLCQVGVTALALEVYGADKIPLM